MALSFIAIALALPTSLNAQNALVVAWDPNPETDVAGYVVYLGTASGDYTTIQDVGNVTTYALTGLSAATKYHCALQAYNEAGVSSELSSEITFTTLPPGPEIAVKNSTGADFVSGATVVPMGFVSLGNSGSSRTFTLLNRGTTDLTGLAITTDGPNNPDFMVSPGIISPLTPGSSATFTVTFKPSAAGTRKATVHILSNDKDEPSFDITFTGTSGTSSDLLGSWAAVAGLGGSEAAPGAMPFNDGVSNLLKYAFNMNAAGPDTRVLIGGSGVVGLPAISLDRSGQQPMFTVEYLRRKNSGLVYTPKISTDLVTFEAMTGTQTETSIDHEWDRVIIRKPCDPAITPRLFAIMEVSMLPDGAPAPEIAVANSAGSGMLAGSSTASFGSLALGSAGVTKTYTVTNEGTSPLTGLSISIAASGASAFYASALSANTLAPGESITFNVTFGPTVGGDYTADAFISSNDADEASFGIALAGIAGTPAGLFDNWVGLGGLTGSSAAAGATPFSDGVPNLLKYAFNLNADGPDRRTLSRGAGTAGLPACYLDQSGPQPMFTVEYLRRKNSGLVYTPKISTDLVTFETMKGTSSETSINNEWERVVIRKPCDPANIPRLFGIVEVRLP